MGPVNATENTGSADFTMCAKDTAIWPKLVQADTWPTVWKKATGMIIFQNLASTLGFFWRPRTHSAIMYTPETAAGGQGQGAWLVSRKERGQGICDRNPLHGWNIAKNLCADAQVNQAS